MSSPEPSIEELIRVNSLLNDKIRQSGQPITDTVRDYFSRWILNEFPLIVAVALGLTSTQTFLKGRIELRNRRLERLNDAERRRDIIKFFLSRTGIPAPDQARILEDTHQDKLAEYLLDHEFRLAEKDGVPKGWLQEAISKKLPLLDKTNLIIHRVVLSIESAAIERFDEMSNDELNKLKDYAIQVYDPLLEGCHHDDPRSSNRLRRLILALMVREPVSQVSHFLLARGYEQMDDSSSVFPIMTLTDPDESPPPTRLQTQLGSIAPPDLSQFALLREAAKITGVSLITIQQAIKTKRLPTSSLAGGRKVVSIADCLSLWPSGGQKKSGRPSAKGIDK